MPLQQGISLQWNSEMNGTRTSSIFRRNLVLEMFVENVLLSGTFRSFSRCRLFRFRFFLFFETYFASLQLSQDIYNRTWPTLMADRMSHQIEKLKHCEMGIVAFDDEFRKTHREARVVQGTLHRVCARHKLVASVKSAHSSEGKFCLPHLHNIHRSHESWISTIQITLQPLHMQIAEQAVIGHCKMALAYLDAREARIAMKLCECHDWTFCKCGDSDRIR